MAEFEQRPTVGPPRTLFVILSEASKRLPAWLAPIPSMKRAATILMLAAMPASATDALTFCHRALAADLSKYSDDQFKTTLCSASKVYLQATKAGDHAASSACMKTIEKMMPEFAKRFPGRKPHEVVGRCE